MAHIRQIPVMDTNANLASANRTFGKGELAQTSDSPRVRKFGDGSTAWNSNRNVIRPYYHIQHLACPAATAGGGVQESLFNEFTSPLANTWYFLDMFSTFDPVKAGCTMGRIWASGDITNAGIGVITFICQNYPEIQASMSSSGSGYSQTAAGGVWNAIPWIPITSVGNSGFQIQYKMQTAGVRFKLWNIMTEWI